MRLATAFLALIAATPALASGSSTERFSAAWTALPTTHFSAWSQGPATAVVPAKIGHSADELVREALRSTTDTRERRDIVVNELAASWEPARRTVLEDLRDAERVYASSPGDSEARDRRFVALLNQVVDGNGRSVAHEPSQAGDDALHQVYDAVVRDTPDASLPALEASEAAWIAYRDAFDRFAMVMDRPDAATMVHDDLARQRATELKAVSR